MNFIPRVERSGPTPNESRISEQESQWLEQAQSGDTHALMQLWTKYERKLLIAINEVIKNREQAEDILQDVFIKVFRKIDSFNGESGFYSWAHSIAFHTALDKKRRVAEHRTVYYEAFQDGNSVERAENPESILATNDILDTHNPEALLLEKEAQQAEAAQVDQLTVAVAQLSPTLRETFELYHQKRTYKQIADEQKISMGTVMSRIYEAKRQLKRLLPNAELDEDLTLTDETLALLWEEHQADLYSKIVNVVKNEEIAQDILQDLFIKLSSQKDTINQERSFYAWAAKAANQTATAYRRNKTIRDQRLFIDDLSSTGHEMMTNILVDTATPENLWMRNEAEISLESTLTAIPEAIAALPTEYRFIVESFYNENKTITEISQLTGLTETNVKTRLFRAREKLRKYLEEKNT